jgi:FtsZ-binding cell division protein ZapB
LTKAVEKTITEDNRETL